MQTRSIAGLTAILTAALLVLTAGMARAADIYVSTGGNDGNNFGTGWGDAYATIAKAFTEADAGDTIHVAGGTYTLSAQLNWPAVAGLTLIGGYEGDGAPGANNPTNWPTVITGGNHRLMEINTRSVPTIARITFRNGGSSSTQQSGAGIYMVDVTGAMLVHCLFVNNNARGSGGDKGHGMYALRSTGEIDGCLFVAGNIRASDDGYGAGINLSEGQWLVRNTVLAGNYLGAAFGSGGVAQGGGAWLKGDHTFRNVMVINNIAPGTSSERGGGIYIDSGAVTLENVTVAGNYPDGIWNQGGTVTLRNSILWRNHGVDLAGTLPSVLENNLISDGTADGDPNGNFAADPLFEFPMYYLHPDSPAIGVGDGTAGAAGVAGLTSFTNGAAAQAGDIVNLGYHFPEGVVWDTNLYVNGSVEVSGDGTESNPFKTIQEALDVAAPRARIHIAAGNYNQASTLTVDGRTVQFLGTNSA